jgi:hypothetical protein
VTPLNKGTFCKLRLDTNLFYHEICSDMSSGSCNAQFLANWGDRGEGEYCDPEEYCTKGMTGFIDGIRWNSSPAEDNIYDDMCDCSAVGEAIPYEYGGGCCPVTKSWDYVTEACDP